MSRTRQVEGGRIDHAHHDSQAHRALDETVAMDEAVEAAMALTSQEDTLIVVTADHAHTMSISGYPMRGQEIIGEALWGCLRDLLRLLGARGVTWGRMVTVSFYAHTYSTYIMSHRVA